MSPEFILRNLILLFTSIMLINFISWEIITLIFIPFILFILKSPLLITSEFVNSSGIQIRNRSFLLILLSILSFFWAFRCISQLSQQINKQIIITLIISLLGFLLLFFFSSEIFTLYTIFELSVIPIFSIIIGWGYQRERIEARLSLIFYTITASLPLLFSFIYLYTQSLTTRITYYDFMINLNNSGLIKLSIFCLIAAFLVKLPIFRVHLWLPKAHVEAPVFGSIVLAAILLKLGRFGILTFFPFLFLDNVNIFISVRIVGGVLVRVLCIRLLDLKIIIAYSSVRHIGCVLIPVIIIRNLSVARGILLIIAHGVRSSAIFLMSYNLYQINFSRSLLLTKGILTFSRSISLIWFLILIINMAAPPTLNLISEILVISRIIFQNSANFLLLIFIVLLGSAYTLIIYRSSIQGTKIVCVNNKVISLREIINIANHIIWGFTLILRVPIMRF